MSSFFETSPFSSSSRVTASTTNARVIPAEVNFLTIYNPSLGDTEETEGDQIVYWGSKDDLSAAQERVGGRTRPAQDDAARPKAKVHTPEHDPSKASQQTQDANYRLRQIGLARGMVDFVKSFSNDTPVSSIETQTSRIILHEVESGWWILANINLTRLPTSAISQSQTQTSTPRGRKESIHSDTQSKPSSAKSESFEYSGREVAPPQLLLAQISKAHDTFLLHHAATLWELYNRIGRSRFMTHLQRYWDKFMWEWDVLLHGNPAVEIYGSCMKLAGGGELGFGVGEEEWGSGEREVLEGFVSRTEGCRDLIVGRYGDAPVSRRKRKDVILPSEQSSSSENEELPQDAWLANGDDPGPADGIIFSGIGTLSRKSLASISQWMEAIFKHGEDAYGVAENPSARPRQNRKHQRPKTARKTSNEPRSIRKGQGSDEEQLKEVQDSQVRFRSPKSKGPDLRRQALENSALPPGIPPPLVSSVERSLDEAIAKASQRASSRSPQSSPTQELTQEEAMKSDGAASWFDTEKMTKVLKLGYGSSWTLNPKGFADQTPANTSKESPVEVEDLLLPEETVSKLGEPPGPHPQFQRTPSKPAEERLQEIDPTPEVSDDESQSKPFLQQLEKSIGRFIIGLSGDLENTEFEDDDGDENNADDVKSGRGKSTRHQRLFIRTLTVQMNRPLQRPSITSFDSSESQQSVKSQLIQSGCPEPKTSAAASVDGPTQLLTHYEKVQVAVYVHQPFIFVFLFSLHTPSLSMPGFYRGIHHQLGPLQIPLLKRTDPERTTERIREVLSSQMGSEKYKNQGAMSQLEQVAGGAGNIIYDLVYDPAKLSVRTSIPNIPVPGSSTDQIPSKNTTVSGSWYTLGIPIGSATSTSSKSRSSSRQRDSTVEQAARLRAQQWPRLDALNVHQQMLNTYIATHSDFSSTAPSTMASTSKSAYSQPAAFPGVSLLRDAELERTVKTNRGWWVLWMRVPSTTNHLSTSSQAQTSKPILSDPAHHQPDKEAFLIRKSADTIPAKSSLKSGGTSSPMTGSGRWLLREQPRESHRSASGGSASDGGSAVTARGVSEGVGIDAKRWVEGLLSLTS